MKALLRQAPEPECGVGGDPALAEHDLEIGLEEARVHARIWATLAASGATLGAPDLLIAATAIGRADHLVTRDMGGFGRVPGLAWERW